MKGYRLETIDATISDAVKTAILATIEAHQTAWNQGDLEGLLSGYRQDEQLRYAFGGDIYRGYPAIKTRFLESYPDPDQMGELTFSNLEVTPFTAQHALGFGRWTIDNGGTQTGLFTLELHKFGDAWKIVSDHTSTA